MTDPTAEWAAALDELEERNRRREAFLDGRGPRPPEGPWRPPDVPLPDVLSIRTRALRDRSVALEHRVRTLVGRQQRRVDSPYGS